MRNKEDLISRGVIRSRLGSWVKKYPSGHEDMFNNGLAETLIQNNDEFIETQLLDKSKPNLTHKPTKHKKEKVWILEAKWISKELYEKYFPQIFRNTEGFTTEWGNTYRKATKFTTLQGAMNYFDCSKKGETPQRDWWSNTKGRNWRIRNIKTNEMYEFKED